MIDIAIIGSGPAGLSAAINAKARNRSVVVLGRSRDTSWLYRAEKVNNHLGMPELNGKEMIDTFYNHAKEQGVEFRTGRVTQIMAMKDHFSISFQKDYIKAQTVILAIGNSKSTTMVEGESELVGKGVSYCATCDGMLYRDTDVVVVGEVEEGEEDANFLSEICKNVYYIPHYHEVKNLNPKVKIINGKLDKILGTDEVEAIEINNKKIECQGVFFVKASISIERLVYGLEVDEKNAIKVDRNMETNIKGLFAAGDCTGWPLQVSKAIGEGLVSAQAADKYVRNITRVNEL